jgi:hypothetical protein
MEQRFGYDFSRVRVHAGTAAEQSVLDVNANAYTVGPNMVFGAGRFAPGTQQGRRLIAHELTHVVQQSGSDGGIRIDSSNEKRGLSPISLPSQRLAVPVGWERALAESAPSGRPLGDGVAPGLAAARGLRIHADERADQLCQDVGASAFTYSKDVYFGRGRFQPGTAAGRELVAHEVAHAMQPRPFSFVQRQPNPAAPPPGPLDYDFSLGSLPMPPNGTTKEKVEQALRVIVAKGDDITSFAPQGMVPGSDAEIFLLWALLLTGKKARWGTEADILTAIGWPAKASDPTPQGQVTLRIDRRGAATAELIAAGPLPAVAPTTVADGTKRLQSDFGFASVTGWGNAAKDAAEIGDVLAALELLKARASQDIPALKGVDLIRVVSLGETGPGRKIAGAFNLGGAMLPGAATPTRPTLKLADEAFSEKKQFVGGGPGAAALPASFLVILHEVGHAVEAVELRAAQEEFNTATAEVGAARQRLADESKTYQAEYDEAKRKGELPAFWKRRAKQHKESERLEEAAIARRLQAGTRLDGTKVTAAAVQPLEAATAALSTTAGTSLTAARNAVRTLTADALQRAEAYTRALDEVAAAIPTFAADSQTTATSVEDLELIVFQKIWERDKLHLPLLQLVGRLPQVNRAMARLGDATQAQDAWFESERVLARARFHTLRLQKFVDLVAANHIRRFTQYSVENWELRPGEFYAEAYSLWLTDRVFLETNYKVVFDFFESGDYRK